jgi:hypothetical protein
MALMQATPGEMKSFRSSTERMADIMAAWCSSVEELYGVWGVRVDWRSALISRCRHLRKPLLRCR